MRTAILVGAGASAFGPGIVRVKQGLSGAPVLETENPPLGSGLYRALASTYPDSWGRLDWPDNGENFEHQMRVALDEYLRLADDSDRYRFEATLTQFIEFFTNFRLNSESLYSKMVSELIRNALLVTESPNSDFTFASLNYERLLEFALQEHGVIPWHNSRPDEKAGRVAVWKPHGSCHFALSPPDSEQTRFMYMREEVIAGGEGVRVLSSSGIHQYLDDWFASRQAGFLYPGMVFSLYEPTKVPLQGTRALAKMRERYAQDFSTSDVVVLIGVSYNAADSHIFEPIMQSKSRVLYVGPPTDPRLPMLEAALGSRLEIIADSFEAALESERLVTALLA